MDKYIDCPVDNVTVNETKVRLVAFFVLALAVLYLVTNSCIIVLLLVADFLLRSFNLNIYSPLGFISDRLVKLFKLKNKPVDRAPKRFAAFMGLAFTIIILITLLLGTAEASRALTYVLIVFALLESFIGFCAGCYVYSLFKKI